MWLATVLASAVALVSGAINPAVTPENVHRTICVEGWTATIRPPAAFTTRLKLQQMAQFHLAGATKEFEEDHLIPLELGGAPRDPANLWPQPWVGAWNAHDKDRVENELHRLVCSGRLSLREAQDAIRTDWVLAYLRFLGTKTGRKHGRKQGEGLPPSSW